MRAPPLWLSTAACLWLAARAPGALGERAAEAARLQCPVCRLLVAEAQPLAVELGVATGGADAVGDFVERICSVQTREGRWLRYLDVTGERELSVERRPEPGECRSECITLKAACGLTLNSHEEDLVSALTTGRSVKEMTDRVCRKTCLKTFAALKRPRRDEEFVPDPRGLKIIEMLEKREEVRRTTGQIIEVMNRDEMDQRSKGDIEAIAAQDAFAGQLQEARHRSGRDWKGNALEL